MVRQTTTEAVAEVSISEHNGTVYLGIGVRDQLGIGYNDKVSVTIPSAGETVTGFVNSSGQVFIGRETAREIIEEARTEEGTKDAPVTEAEVAPGREVWEDANGGAVPRRESAPHHSSQIRNW